MEVLTLILKRRVRHSDNFRFHNHCEELQIINVCFADDLFNFACGDVESAMVIMDSLDEFKRDLPVKYLGVPLIFLRLLNKDCKILVEKAKNRIGDWKNKSLSFARRLQLCEFIISSMHVYWASVLLIPKAVVLEKDLTQLRCPLCDTQMDTHAHLFFECPFSKKVWLYVRRLTDMELVPPILDDIILHLQPMSHKRTTQTIIGRLISAASSYFIWLERNNCLFKMIKRSLEEIRDVIMVTVRLKLISFRFKNTVMVNQLLSH
ncbi:RNA-directed DNA polymerase, eukaryota, reverse transcriptase zinc-binding domain protein [Tanacetum coccineum]